MHNAEAYVWLGILILMPFVAILWHYVLTPLILGEPTFQTSLRDDSAAAPDPESDSRCNSFTK